MTATTRCPCCAGVETEHLGRVGPVPVLCGSLWATREEARGTGSAFLDLAVCRDCAHVWNESFAPELVEYDTKYDNSLEHSATFLGYAGDLVDRLVRDHDLRGKTVVEIGSGQGAFLRALCAAGGNRGFGYDPTYAGPEVDGDLTFVRTFFDPSTSPAEVDFLCSRHVLEHLADPYAFLVGVREAVAGRAVPMYFEVPNAEFNFAESGPWDLIYPHVSYFSDTSVQALLSRAGFEVSSVEPSFSGQFLSIEAVPDAPASAARSDDRARSLAKSYATALRRQVGEVRAWQRRIDEAGRDGGLGLWGAGSKGITFLSMVDPDRTISVVVDSNPHKWGRYLPGPGHRVLAPAELARNGVRSVLVMNPAYAEEIREQLRLHGGRADVLLA